MCRNLNSVPTILAAIAAIPDRHTSLAKSMYKQIKGVLHVFKYTFSGECSCLSLLFALIYIICINLNYYIRIKGRSRAGLWRASKSFYRLFYVRSF